MSNQEKSELISQFVAVTGCSSETVARNLLDACSNNVEVAINMFLESDSGVLNGGPSSMPLEESVRAPIPHKQETMVEPESITFSFRGKGRKRGGASVFDTFRDFQAETRAQEEEVKRNGTVSGLQNAASSTSKRKTLEDLFRPPFDLMHRGSFQSARDAGVGRNKWLLVNIQDASEFSCQILNRDVWSNPAVKSIVKEHFIFWQVYIASEEGQRYQTFYPVKKYPYVSIIDPVTGEGLVVWNSIDATSFCDLSSAILERHVDGPSPKATQEVVPAKKRREETIVDADENDQLEAAIQASLSQLKPRPDTTDSESELEAFSDDSQDVPEAIYDSRENESSSRNKSGRPGSKGKDRVQCDEKAVTPATNDGVESDLGSEGWKEYLGGPEDPQSRLILRFPAPLSTREQFELPCTSSLSALLFYVESKGFPLKEYELRTSFPTRILLPEDGAKTLKEMGLFPQETIFVNSKQ